MWQSLDLDTLGLAEADVTTASYWIDTQGGAHRGERGIAQLLVDRGGVWAFGGRALMTPPVSWLAKLVYGVIVKNRHKLPGSTEACRLSA